VRRINGIPNLLAYLESVDYPLTEDRILELIHSKDIPHQRPFKDLLVFNTDHIDWWISTQKKQQS
jgi:hypothetical protein